MNGVDPLAVRDSICRFAGENPAAFSVLVLMLALVIWLSAEGVVTVGRRADKWATARRARWQQHRAKRLAVREPGRALAADDDRRIWRETDPEPRPRCQPRQPRAAEVLDLITAATRLCRDAAAIRHDDG